MASTFNGRPMSDLSLCKNCVYVRVPRPIGNVPSGVMGDPKGLEDFVKEQQKREQMKRVEKQQMTNFPDDDFEFKPVYQAWCDVLSTRNSEGKLLQWAICNIRNKHADCQHIVTG